MTQVPHRAAFSEGNVRALCSVGLALIEQITTFSSTGNNIFTPEKGLYK
jgi:hypothetical protein